MSRINNTLKLLRFPFSIFLLPVTLFALFYIHPKLDLNLFLVLFVWHVLVFPASNGYNSFNDRDEGPIGGLKSPPLPTIELLNLCNIMDGVAILLSVLVSFYFTFFVAIYIVVSRLYSNKNIRLKKYPFIGFMVVFIFQGAWIFCADLFAFSCQNLLKNNMVIFSAIASSFFIGTIYPITQIYQHESDKKDNVNTLSMVLGIKGTFIFSALFFLIATGFVFLAFRDSINNFWLFNLVMFPSTLFFLIWAFASFRNLASVNFRNTMVMLILSSLLNNLFFLILLFK